MMPVLILLSLKIYFSKKQYHNKKGCLTTKTAFFVFFKSVLKTRLLVFFKRKIASFLF